MTSDGHAVHDDVTAGKSDLEGNCSSERGSVVQDISMVFEGGVVGEEGRPRTASECGGGGDASWRAVLPTVPCFQTPHLWFLFSALSDAARASAYSASGPAVLTSATSSQPPLPPPSAVPPAASPASLPAMALLGDVTTTTPQPSSG